MTELGKRALLLETERFLTDVTQSYLGALSAGGQASGLPLADVEPLFLRTLAAAVAANMCANALVTERATRAHFNLKVSEFTALLKANIDRSMKNKWQEPK